MPVIKRYANRKLYDMEAKRYITLDKIAEKIRKGEEIQVIDNVTGADISATTLTQIIYEQEKKQEGHFPLSLLTSIIRAGTERLYALQRTLPAALNPFDFVDEEIKHRIDILIDMGEIKESEAQGLLEKFLSLGEKSLLSKASLIEDQVRRIMQAKGVPTRADLDALLEQLDNLAAQLDDLAIKGK